MDDKGKQFYDYLSSQGIEVPPSYEEFSTQMQNKETAGQFHSFVSSKGIEVPKSVDEFTSVFAPTKSTAPEKKSSTGPTPGALSGLGGSLGGPSPLAASKTPPKTTFGEGALDVARTPEPKRQMPARDGFMPSLPSGGMGRGLSVPDKAVSGLGGEQTPSPLKAAATPPKQTFGEGALDEARNVEASPFEMLESIQNERVRLQEEASSRKGVFLESLVGMGGGRAAVNQLKKEADGFQQKVDETNPMFMDALNQSNKAIDNMVKDRIGKDLSKFVTTDKMGFSIADPIKVSDWASKIAMEMGLPDDGHAKRAIENNLTDKVAFHIIEPEVTKEFEKRYGAKLGELPKDVAAYVGEQFDVTKINTELESFAKQSNKLAGEEKKQNEIAAFGGVTYEQYVQGIKQNIESASQSMEAKYSSLVNENNEFIGTDAQFAEYNADAEKIKSMYSEADTELKKAYDSAMDVDASINRKYNRLISEKEEQALRAYKRYEEERNARVKLANPLLEAKAKKAYEQALKAVSDKEEGLRGKIASAMPLSLLAASAWTSSVSGSMSRIGELTGSETLRVYGKQYEKAFNTGSPDMETMKDWLDVHKAVRSAANLGGSMTTSMIPAVIIGAATGGLGAPAWLTGTTAALASATFESMDIAGGIAERTIAETGDAAKATERVAQTFTSQRLLAPTYFLEMLPVFGKIAKGGLLKRVAIGSAVEYSTETALQEFPQQLFEDAIMNDKGVKGFFENFEPDNFNKTVEKFGSVARNTIAVAPLGGLGQARGYYSEQADEAKRKETLKKNINTAYTKAKLGDLTGVDAAQNALSLVTQKGREVAQGVVSMAYMQGEIDFETFGNLSRRVDEADAMIERVNKSYDGGDNQNKYIIASMHIRQQEHQKRADAENDPLFKSQHQKKADDAKKVIDEIFESGQPNYTRIEFSNGSFTILTNNDAKRKMSDPAFMQAFTNGDIKVEAFGKDSQKMTEALAASTASFKGDERAAIDKEIKLANELARQQSEFEAEREGYLLKREEELGIIPQIMEPTPKSVSFAINRIEKNLPTDPIQAKNASDWLYAEYKKIRELKNDPSRNPLSKKRTDELLLSIGADIEMIESHLANMDKARVSLDEEQSSELAQEEAPAAFVAPVAKVELAPIVVSESNKETPAEPTKEAPKEPVSESELNKKKADIEKRREAELSANKKLTEVSGGAVSGESQLANEINAKYDAELAALEKPAKPFISSFGTPVKDLGKTLEGVSQTNLDGVNVLMSEVDESTVKLESIETPKKQRDKGKAKAALQKIVDKADELGKIIILDVNPKDETIDKDRLIKLYEGFGFTPTKGIGMERKPGAKPSDKKSDKKEGATNGNSVKVFAAPFYNQLVLNAEEAESVQKSPAYKKHLETIQNIADEVGLSVKSISTVIGGYTHTETGRQVREITPVIEFNSGQDFEKVTKFAAIMGALSPEVQETTIAARVINESERETDVHTATLISIKVDNFDEALKLAQESGLDHSANINESKIEFLDFAFGEDADFDEKLDSFAIKLNEKGIKHESEKTAIESRLIGATAAKEGEWHNFSRKEIFEDIKREVGFGERGQQFRDAIAKAEKRNNEFIRQQEVNKERIEYGQLREKEIELQRNGKNLTAPERKRMAALAEILLPNTKETFTNAKDDYEEAKAEIEVTAKKIAEGVGFFASFDIKRAERAAVKVLRWYKGQSQWLGDGARTNIIVFNEKDIEPTIMRIKEEYNGGIVRDELKKTDLGYPKKLLEVRTSNGKLAEFQVMTPEGYLAKDGVKYFPDNQKSFAQAQLSKVREKLGWAIPDGVGHYFYEIDRDSNVPESLRNRAKSISLKYYDAFLNPNSTYSETEFRDDVSKFKKDVDNADKSEWDDGNKALSPETLNDFLSSKPKSTAAKELSKKEADKKAAMSDLAKRLRDKKIGGVGFVDPFFGLIGISKTIYDGALELAAKQIEKGTKLGVAIANAMKYVDERMNGAKWDKGLFGRHLNDQFKMTVNGKEVEVKRDLSTETLDVVNGWYSPLEKSIKDTKADSLTAKEWLDKVRSKEGEDLWTGLRGVLEAKNPKDRVSKRELLNFLKDNRVDVVEVVKGDQSPEAIEAKKKLDKFDDETAAINDQLFVLQRKYDRTGDISFLKEKNRLSEESLSRVGKRAKILSEYPILSQLSDNQATKFKSYQLAGEKENYKEVLVILPSKNPLLQKVLDLEKIYEKHQTNYNARTLEDAKQELSESGVSSFRSSHFSEPNIVVHLRMNTRLGTWEVKAGDKFIDADGNISIAKESTTASGKVLFLEEVQSDWGQKGKREGFKSDKKDAELKMLQEESSMATFDFDQIEEELDRQYEEKKKEGESRSELRNRDSDFNKLAQQYAPAEQRMMEAGRAFDLFQAENRSETPSAPFVTDTNSWVKLGVKVALKEAVAQGVDKIAWTTGEQQNERYSLEKIADEIKYRKNSDGTYRIVAYKRGENVSENKSLKEDKLEETLGKDVAQRIIDGKGERIEEDMSLTGENLKVGGKGMKGFYGSPSEGSLGIVGNVVESLTGQEPNTVEIDKGISSYSVVKGGKGEFFIRDNRKDGQKALLNLEFDNENDAIEWIAKNSDRTIQHSIDITPEIKQAVKTGLPLFGSKNEILAKAIRDKRVKGLTFVDPAFGLIGISVKLYNAAVEIIANQVENNTELGKAIQAAVEFIENELKGAPWNKKAFEDSFSDVSDAGAGTGNGKKKRGKGKGPKKGKKKSYEARQLKEFADSQVLTDAIKATGTRYEAISWKEVQPISNSIVADIFSDPSTVNEKAEALANTIAQTTNEDYRNNDGLSTLHALVAHQMIAEFAKIGDIDNFQKWSNEFSQDGRWRGRFISAMQHDASPYAISNRVRKAAYTDMSEAIGRTTADGAKIQDEIDALKSKLKLSDDEIGRLTSIVNQLTQNQAPSVSTQSQQPPSPQQQKKGLDRVKSGLAKLSAAISGTRRQMNAMMPITTEIIDAIKEIALGIAESGVYQAEKIRKAVMKQIKAAFPNDKNAVDSIDAALDGILEDDAISEAMDEAEEAALVDKLVARAKMNAITKAPKAKTAEEVLLDTLLAKMNETIKKESPKREIRYADRIREGIVNAEYSDEIWREAMMNVEIWLGEQKNISDERKAEILASMEDSVSAFMDQPFANSDLRKALKQGIKDLGVEIARVVKEHWSVQDNSMTSIQEKLISELGLSIDDANRYSDAIIEEIEKIFAESRVSEINKMLGLDASGAKKEKKDSVNKRASDKILQAINLGVMDDYTFRSLFAEKYGFIAFSPADIRQILRFNDLINIHQGREMSRFYLKQMMDYVENLKPYDAEKFYNTLQSLMIRGMLNGLNTMAVNIPIGSQLSYMASAYPSLFANPVAYAAFRSSFGATGLGGIGIKSFADIMSTGFNVMDEGADKFDDRKDVRGDQVDYWLNNYDGSKFWSNVRNSKSPKEAIDSIRIAMGRSMIMTNKLSNYAKAFDAIINFKATELDQFMQEYEQQAKAAGYSGMRARFDPTVAKEILDAVKKKMAYDTETVSEITDMVDSEIAAMKTRGERVGFGLRQRMIKAEMESRREQAKVAQSLERVRAYVLMENPTGILGEVYGIVSEKLAINKGISPTKAFGKYVAKSMFGLFLRITVTSFQKGVENVPVIGLTLPGIFYDKKLLPVDEALPNGKKEWRWVAQDAQTRNKKLATHAATMAIFTLAAASMFSMDDEEDEVGRKSKKLKLNPDRWLDITGFGTGKFYDNESLRKEGKERKDYTVSIKVNGKWHDIMAARLIPHLMPTIALLGGLRDEAELNPTGFKNSKVDEQILNGMDDVVFASTAASFATIPKNTQKLFYAASGAESASQGVADLISESASILIDPTRAAVYPNFLRDVRNEVGAVAGTPSKMGRGVLYSIAKDFPVAGEMVGEDMYDVFGYKKTRTSKVLASLTSQPGATIILDNLIDNGALNADRFNQDVWKLKSDYQPNIVIASYFPKSETPEDKTMMNAVYGEQMRNLWLSHEKYVKAYDFGQMTELQSIFHKEAVTLMEHKVGTERVEKLQKSYDDGVKSGVSVVKLNKIKESLESWKGKMEDLEMFKFSDDPEINSKYSVKRVYDKMKDHNYDVKVGGGISLPYIPDEE